MKRLTVFALFCTLVLFPVFGDEPDELTRAMEKAIRDNDIATVTSLLKAGANPNGVHNEEYGNTFLMLALRFNNQLAELLLDYGADPDIRRKDGQSAVYYFDIEEIVLLISRGARFDIIDNKNKSPLMYRMEENHRNLSLEATLILEWEETHAPGFTGGYNTRQDYLTALLPPFFRSDFERRDDGTGLKLVERLLSLGADPLVRSRSAYVFHNIDSNYRYRQEMLTLFLDRGAPLDSVNRNNETLLMRAAERRFYDEKTIAEMEFLLDRGANPNFQNKDGETALMYAKTAAAVNVLLARGAQPDVQNKDGETALMHNRLYPEVLKALLNAGADPSIRDNRGRNVLFRIRSSDEDALDLDLLDGFLAGGCDINAYDNRGYTAILLAADRSDSPVILALLERGADPLVLDGDGKTVLQIYLESRRSSPSRHRRALEMEMIEALLEAGVQPSALDDKGNSALLYVMRKNDSDIKPIQDLLQKYTSNDDKKTANAILAAEKKEKTRNTLSNESTAISWGIGLPVVVGGFSILMREVAFAGNKSANFMGPVNSMLTFGTAGFFLGTLLMAGGISSGSGPGAMFDGLAAAFVGGSLGLIGGIIIGCLPGVRRAFNDYPALYYTPTAMSVIGGSVILFNVFF